MVHGPEGDGDGYSCATALAGQIDNVAQFCRDRQISRQTFDKFRRRFDEEGLAGLQERSRRPCRVRPRPRPAVEEWCCADASSCSKTVVIMAPQSIQWSLQRDEHPTCRRGPTVWRILTRHGLITPQPQKPKSGTHDCRVSPWGRSSPRLGHWSTSTVSSDRLGSSSSSATASRCRAISRSTKWWPPAEQALAPRGPTQPVDCGRHRSGRPRGIRLATGSRLRTLTTVAVGRPIDRIHGAVTCQLVDQRSP